MADRNLPENCLNDPDCRNPYKKRQLKIYMKSTWLNASAEDVFLPSALNAYSLFEIGSEAYCINEFLSYSDGFESNFSLLRVPTQIHSNNILCREFQRCLAIFRKMFTYFLLIYHYISCNDLIFLQCYLSINIVDNILQYTALILLPI